ncbi:hypothetical protein MPSEU_000746500 [Mayamaea pseudoterrestris]|nr:hypothetical protein MPSEU_000746500 [Mayamaea pseudoterrestris]
MASLRPNNSTNPPPARPFGAMQQANAAPGGNTAAKNQFEAWAREKETFIKEAEAADRELAEVENKTAELRARQQELLVKIRIAKQKAGAVESQKQALMQRKEQLTKQYSIERTALEECAKEIERLTQVERQAKRDFCAKTKAANEEWGRLLKKQETLRMKRLIGINVGTVHAMADRMAASTDVGPEVKQEMEAAVSLFEHALAKYQETKAQLENKQRIIGELRERAKLIPMTNDSSREPQFLTDDALDTLEQTWLDRRRNMAKDDSSTTEQAMDKDSVGMDLFYGNGESQESSVAEYID